MSRKIINFNSNWLFTTLPTNGTISAEAVQKADYPDSGWESVTLPHTYNATDGTSGRTGPFEGGEHYYRGSVCYRRKFRAYHPDKCVFIEFGAVSIVAEIYVNGEYVGVHKGGYSAFRFDISRFLKADENTIAVIVSNAPSDHIAPITDQGDFTKMGGIYRDVQLVVTEKAHIDMLDYGSSGIYITPKNITAEKADTDILVRLANDDSKKKALTVCAEIYDNDNRLVTAVRNDTEIDAEAKETALLTTAIERPRLWQGRSSPHLYTAKITVSEGEDLLDEATQTFGIRSFYIDKEKGFYLNGVHTDLHGVNYHQDSYENGWAMNDEQRRRDYDMMLDMGCNAVRMAHYQHCRHEYELCDRHGLSVWTEIGIVNKIAPDNDTLTIEEGFAENAKQQLTELIRQCYNHPCIIVWGISNELYQMSDDIYSLWCELSGLARKEDGTRLITLADNQFWGRFLDMPVDVVGYNRYFGWYKDAGPAEKFGEWLDEQYCHKANHPICVSEYGGGGAITQHKDSIVWEDEIDPWGKRHYESYQAIMHEKIWEQFSKRRYLWGKFIWCMFDFSSDGREEGDTVGQNDKGLCTRERIPKDAYFFYKSVWNDKPMVHITEKRFTTRPYIVPVVRIYSNAEKTELFVNGISAGFGEHSEGSPTVFLWKNVQLKKGEGNIISVKATLNGGKMIQDEAVWTGC